jgi:biotin carboxylase
VRLLMVASKPTDAVTYGFLPAAERLGLDVLLLTDQPEDSARALIRGRTHARPTPGRTYPRPRIAGCDVHDTSALIGRIAELPAPAAVFSNSDRLQTQTALAAEYFGLPGKDWRSCLRAKNKPLMRQRLAGTGAEKVTAIEITAESAYPPPDLPYPVVLKPAEGVASEDVVLVGSAGELALRCAEMFRRRPGERLIAEEYLPGTLRTLETLGDGQTTWVLGGFRTTVSPPPFFIEERLTWEPLPPGGELDQVRRALADLGVSFGACHTEFICDEQGGARLVEVNDRLIGDHCDFLLDGLLTEDLFERVLLVHLGEPLPTAFPPVTPGHAVADFIVAERSGVLATAPPRAPLAGAQAGDQLGTQLGGQAGGQLGTQLGGQLGVGPRAGYWPLRQPGERITVTHSNRDYLGVITAIGPELAAVERSVAAARSGGRWVIAP